MPKPNIIWIMSDDLSWGDLGCFGQQHIATPHIDALASGGMRLTHCYSGAPVCAPSRSTLMQGLHLGHATVRDNMTRHRNGVYRHCLQPDDRTVAHLLQEAGYRTGLFGKWGLALCDQSGQPNAMGFDSFFGYLNQRRAHSYYPHHLWSNTTSVPYPQHEGHDHRQANEYDADGRIIVSVL
jgi:arylsulfatase A-like enzyme